jgi:tRNA (adenine37-N6)-methyltransferase
VVFWFHQNSSWRPKVLPPRSTTGRKGVFATRAPYRPNPIGLSALRLMRIDGLVLHVQGVDMLDGTPVLDIKPYVPYTDAHPAARSGWLEDSERVRNAAGTPADPVRCHQVVFSAAAAEQARWIESHTGLPAQARIIAVLSMGPEPHPYRRIRREGSGYRLALKEWRVHFRIEGEMVLVDTIRSGYRAAQLDRNGDEAIAAHRLFQETFRS